MATSAPPTSTTLAPAGGIEAVVDAIVDEVKGFFKLHYDNITGTADIKTKIKVLLYDGRMWMLWVSILLLVLAYQSMRAKNAAKAAAAAATARPVYAHQ